ncbi:carbohydrate ABC transporter permease [Pseudonocardia kunmingensis]|uniref:Carbohydrate ABC transporter membrane protein 2 (CUT1 family) n=1 Tax=Pseudonocardia kunmingensis TaxID=630975 RepID=A0A543DQE7_9PSEU|nr:carbohydrate ABC transporter permease [Pseudonocardia kunmingensis]TQM11534.1 carbohydrate ABC transporter membrane protein 2 (CUT1 family) [Pseudonocardia kunmingensis]
MIAYRLRAAVLVGPLAVLTALTMVPFVWVVLSAFKDEGEIFGSPLGLPQNWTWVNFVTVWTSGGFAGYFVNSLVVAVAATALIVLVACPAGYVFGKLATRLTDRLFYLLLFTITLPIEAIVVPVFYQFRSMGLVDTRLGLVLILVATGTPLGVFITRSFFRDLPDSLAEAAKIDGASDWRTFLSVMLPLAKPALLAVAVFSFLAAWNEYLLALLLLFDDTARTIPVGLTQFQGQYSSDYGALFAGIVLAMIPSILVYVFLQRSFTRGLLAGSVK